MEVPTMLKKWIRQWRHYLNHGPVIEEYHVPYEMYEYDGRHYQVMQEWGLPLTKAVSLRP